MISDQRPTIVYVGDPMCSWCWGFAPVLEQLVAEHDVDLKIVVGGLRPGQAAQPLSDRMKTFLLHHWEQVEAASGQPFNSASLAARDATWMYDTELPAVAMNAMRRIKPTAELAFFFTLQHAFYVDGIDITDSAAYPSLLDAYQVDPPGFVELLAAPEVRSAAWDDFAEARRLGATGFPTTLLDVDGRYRMLAAGYRPYAEVDQILHAALDRRERFADGGRRMLAHGEFPTARHQAIDPGSR